MCFLCPVCNSSQKENIFYFKESVKSPHRLDCIVYQNFLNIISKDTGLNKDLIDILYFKNELSEIINIENFWCEKIKDFTLKLPDNILFKENYEKKISFIFANIIQLNKGYNIYLTDKYGVSEYELDLLNNKEKYNIKLSIPRLATTLEENKIFIKIEFNKYNCIPYDINLLNEEEKVNLLEKLNNLRDNLFLSQKLFKLIYEKGEDKVFFVKEIDIDTEEKINSIYINIEEEIEKFYNEILKFYEPLKEKYEYFFERALLELELQNF